MKNTNMTKLIMYAAVLFSFLLAGCAHMSSSGTMGGSKDTMMEENSTEMNTPVMNGTMEKKDEPMMEKPMNDMNGQKMGTTADMMKTDDMMEQPEKKMDSGTDKMMK